MVAPTRARLALASAFAEAAGRYWLEVFPRVGREVRHWQRRARAIPDPALRRLALWTQRTERGNLDGAAAFAVLAPRAQRERVVRAVVSFQAAYDFVDTLAEQPSSAPLANGRQLHLALLTALDPDGEHADYYAFHSDRRDGGYMRSMIDTCRDALAALPSYEVVREPARVAAMRMIAYQTYTHEQHAVTERRAGDERHAALTHWAASLTPADSGLRWWETAAGAASSLVVFALIAAAARPDLAETEVKALEDAYFPWIGALHVLLDSLVDRVEDLGAGHHSLVDHYASPEEEAERLQAIAICSLRAAEALPEGTQHALILAAMSSFYISAPQVGGSYALPATRLLQETMGALAAPTMLVLRARHAVASALASTSQGALLPGPQEQHSLT